MRGGGRNFQRRLSRLEDWNVDLVLHLLDPERGRHLDRICVRRWGVSCGGALEKGDVGGPTTQFGACGCCGDGEEGRLGDGLSVVGVAQHGVRVGQSGLGNRARRNEFGEVLRQSWGVRGGSSLAGERDLFAGGADHERSDVHRRDGWRACDAGGGC